MKIIGYLIVAAIAVFIFLFNTFAMWRNEVDKIQRHIRAILQRRLQLAQAIAQNLPESTPAIADRWRQAASLSTALEEDRKWQQELPHPDLILAAAPDAWEEFQALQQLLQEQLDAYRDTVTKYNRAAATPIAKLLFFKTRETL